MELKEISKQLIDQSIREDNYSRLLEILDSLFMGPIPDDIVCDVCAFIEIRDKAVRNNTVQLLNFNPNSKISKCIAKYIASEDIQIRNLAGEILIRRGSDSVEPLLAMLPSANADDRKFIIDILGLVGDERSVKPIEEDLITEDNDNVILSCIEALGNLNSVSSVELLISFIEKSDLFRPTIIEALGKSDCKESRDFLISIYDKEDDLVKYSIVESLGKIGNEETFFFLLNELQKSSGAIVYPIINSIQKLQSNFGFDIPFDERMKNLLLETIYEAEDEFKFAAAQLLLNFDDPQIIASLLFMYGRSYEIDEMLKDKFFQNLDVVLDKIPEVLNKNPNNGGNILLLLKEILEVNSGVTEIEKRNLISAISSKLTLADEEIRRTSMELLFILDPDSALLFSDLMINDNVIWNKLRFIELLEGNENPLAIEALEKLSKDEEEMVKESAVSVLLKRLSNTKK